MLRLLFCLTSISCFLSIASTTYADPIGGDVLTYHVDKQRTGWNSREEALAPSAVSSKNFGPLKLIPLDDQVDAQPLVVTTALAEGAAPRHLVYLVTENNTVYALDAATGAEIVPHRTLGPPVPKSTFPGQCGNNGSTVGIHSTPVSDGKALYLVAYIYDSGAPQWRVYKLDLATLKDLTPPVEVRASGNLADGTTFVFNARNARQRAALLLSNHIVYAAFASFCDIEPDKSRGWILGFHDDDLRSLDNATLTNRLVSSSGQFFLTSIWMSGYGPSADSKGNLFVVTGNSDPSRNSYDGEYNLQHSVLKLSADLASIDGYFTPSDIWPLEQKDMDFGSGGVMVIPDHVNSHYTRMAVATGKAGRMYLLNRDDLGGYNRDDRERVIEYHDIAGCWCGPSYFKGDDGRGRIVSSAGRSLSTWIISPTATTRVLQLEGRSGDQFDNIQWPGFFTFISSNQNVAGTTVIWAVGRPTDGTNPRLTLHAFDATPKGASLNELYAGDAGPWPNLGGAANVVPVAAYGHVYVASYKQLVIFGIAPAGSPPLQASHIKSAKLLSPRPAVGTVRVTGVIQLIDGDLIIVQTRAGTTTRVNVQKARNARLSVPLFVGESVEVEGDVRADKQGMDADQILRAMPSTKSWLDDAGTF
jgi:hypothetical protein